MISTYVIKKDGRMEKFSEKKAAGACYRACLNAHLSKTVARKISNETLKDLKKVLKGKREVSTTLLCRQVAKLLRKHDRDVAFLYETHEDLS